MVTLGNFQPFSGQNLPFTVMFVIFLVFAKTALYAAMLIRNDTTAQLMDSRNARTQDQIQRNLAEFRAMEQTAESRREFDLNDPNGLKKACPLGANDHGISSLQVVRKKS